MFTVTGFCDDAGHYSVDNPTALREYIRAHYTGKEFVLTVKAKSRRQGTQQLRYLRGVVIPDIATACGYDDPDDWPEVYNGLMFKFFRLPDGPFGEPRRESASKDRMSMERLSQVIDTLITWGEANIPGCRVRRPEEVDMERVWAPDYEKTEAA